MLSLQKEIRPEPIETAPKDSTHILAWDQYRKLWVAVRWCGWGGGVWQCSATGMNRMGDIDNLTHWIPMLPDPT